MSLTPEAFSVPRFYARNPERSDKTEVMHFCIGSPETPEHFERKVAGDFGGGRISLTRVSLTNMSIVVVKNFQSFTAAGSPDA